MNLDHWEMPVHLGCAALGEVITGVSDCWLIPSQSDGNRKQHSTMVSVSPPALEFSCVLPWVPWMIKCSLWAEITHFFLLCSCVRWLLSHQQKSNWIKNVARLPTLLYTLVNIRSFIFETMSQGSDVCSTLTFTRAFTLEKKRPTVTKNIIKTLLIFIGNWTP